jgi:O-antigen ligase
MKELLLEPLILLLLLLVGVIYTTLFFYSTKNKVVQVFIEKAFIYFLFYYIYTPYPTVALHYISIAQIDSGTMSNLMRLGFHGFLVLIANSWFRNFFVNSLLIFADPFLGLVLLVALLSACWSETPLPSLRASLVTTIVACLAANVAKKYTNKELFRIIRWIHAFLAFISIPLALAMPSIGRDGRGWAGPLGSSKPLSVTMSLGVTLWCIQATSEPTSALMSLAIAFVSFIVMYMTDAKSAIVVTFLLSSLAFMLRTVKSFDFKLALVVTVILVTISSVVTYFLTENLGNIIDSLGKDATLTGRTIFWPKLVDAIMSRPFFGFGYAGFWQESRGLDNPAINIVNPNGYRPSHAHNAFLDTGLQLGLVGLLLFTISYLRALFLAVKYMTTSKATESIVPLLILIFLIISNVTESEYLGIIAPNRVGFYYFLYVAQLSLDTRDKKVRE